MAWLPFRYRDFYDVPRVMVIERAGELYLFDSPFDAEADEYAANFDVYHLPPNVASQLDSSWDGLGEQGERIGRVPVSAIELDPSRRSFVSDDVFNLLPTRPLAAS